MKIAIGNDHGGYVLKLKLMKYLDENQIEYHDFGTFNEEIVRYPTYAKKVCEAIINKEFDRGILICSTGIGMSIMANRFPGIRASVVSEHYGAKMTRAHNNSNVLCLGGKVIGEFIMKDIIDAWLTTEYEGGRHKISLDLIEKFEKDIGDYENNQ
jgi:ribose 5-phosphate isomerase B